MTQPELTDLFARIAALRIGVIGDFALDFYYEIHRFTNEFSLETGLEVHWGSKPRASPGGAGNVVQNLAALGMADVRVFGCVGDDLFGREMRALFAARCIDTAHLLTLPNGWWDTYTYTKPLASVDGDEENRIDFGQYNALPETAFQELLAGLEQALPTLDALILNQQFSNPLLKNAQLAAVFSLLDRFPHVRTVADLRQQGKAVRGALLKVNVSELAWLLGVSRAESPESCEEQARALREITGGPVVVTRGAQGLMYVDGHETVAVPGLRLTGPLDTVGAGDTVVAALTAALAAGAPPHLALDLANCAAAVTVRKLGQTGTATPEEILYSMSE